MPELVGVLFGDCLTAVFMREVFLFKRLKILLCILGQDNTLYGTNLCKSVATDGVTLTASLLALERCFIHVYIIAFFRAKG